MSDANYDIEGMYDEGVDHEIIKGNRDTLLDRLEAPGYHDGFPYGLIDEAVQEIKLLRKERDAALAVVDEFIIDTRTNTKRFLQRESPYSNRKQTLTTKSLRKVE